MTVNVLDDTLCYLIGAIDFAKDQGTSWRCELIQSCKDHGLTIKFLDPTHKIVGLKEEVGEERNKIIRCKTTGQWDELTSIMRVIVRQDHRCVDLSDFVIFYLDTSVHTCGSYFEFQSALTQKKPFFLIIEGGKSLTPAWLFGICDHRCVYGSVKEVVDELIKINTGEVPLTDRWVLFRQQIKHL